MSNESFRRTDTPLMLDTFSGDAEVVRAEWTPEGFVLYVDAVSWEGYSVPVRLVFEGAPLESLRRLVAGS